MQGLRADARCLQLVLDSGRVPSPANRSALPLQLKCSWRIGMPTRSSLTIDRAGSSCHFIETKGQKNRFAFAPSAVKSGNWGQRASAQRSALSSLGQLRENEAVAPSRWLRSSWQLARLGSWRSPIRLLRYAPALQRSRHSQRGPGTGAALTTSRPRMATSA